MKALNPKSNLLLLAAFSFSTCLAQDPADADLTLSSSLVGSWEHVSSTYPWGDVSTYERQMELYADGTGLCTRYTEIDTLLIQFEWEVKDSVIHLFMINKNGKRVEGDSQYISLLSRGKMYLTDTYTEEQTGKVCYYRRMDNEIAKY